MIQRIDQQLQVIERANAWIDKELEGNKCREAHDALVKYRRELKKKRRVLDSNPATAIFGESQVGKSYLVSSLLSGENGQFSLQGAGEAFYNFIESVNPMGGGSESTSLVSRFSVTYTPKNPNFPIKAVLLSPADLILVLSDSFYHDIKLKDTQEVHLLNAEELKQEVISLKERFRGTPKKQSYLTEDDVMDIKDYFDKYFQNTDRIKDSGFFATVSSFIESVDPHQWKDVFSLLWNKNEAFAGLFDRLISEYQHLNFQCEVYLPIESVLNTHGTILDVKRIHELYEEVLHIEPQYTASTAVLLPDGIQVTFNKGYLCALTAELVFGQPKDLVQEKPFLQYTDLLDFPGARSRLDKELNAIEKKTIPELLLRGKVAYLFNMYSDSERIRILMFCAKHEQPAERYMGGILNSWINNVIGQSPEERESFIATSKVSPLFIIGTFFNVNMKFDPTHDRKNEFSSLNYRWLQRFDTSLSKELIEAQTYTWLDKWTTSESYFRNIYLLRDFEKSCNTEGLFKGFNKEKNIKELEEFNPSQFPDFRQELRKSFIEYEFVKNHFKNPAESWDEAASINKDGTALIISKLTIAAQNSLNARQTKICKDLVRLNEEIYKTLNKHYHNADKDEEILRAKAAAGDIQLKLDTAFAADGIRKYGHMIRDMMIEEGDVLRLYRDYIDDIEHQEVANQDIYSTYRIMVPVEDNDTVETYFEKLCVHYEKVTDEQIEQFQHELDDKGINLEELVSGGGALIKNNAQQLADALLDHWLTTIFSPNRHAVHELLAEDGNPSLQEIVEMFKKLFIKIDLANTIAHRIRGYVDGHEKTDLPYEIVADISAELLNRCIKSVGFDYLDAPEIAGLKTANEKNNLGLVFDTIEDNDASLETTFHRVENRTEIMKTHPEEMRMLPSYRNYIEWYNRLKIGFVSVCDIPNYDVAANERLSVILNDCKAISF